MKTMEYRFWKKVCVSCDNSEHKHDKGCHFWKGAKSQGYGKIMMTSTPLFVVAAHRYAFFLKNGHWAKNHTLHSCDNPSCVNSDHLFDGTHSDNIQDWWNKNRRNKLDRIIK